MRFPSFQSLVQESKNTFIRFPFELSTAIIGTLVWVHYIQHNLHDHKSIYQIKILLCCLIGLALYLSGSLFSESKKIGEQKWLIQLGITLLLVFYYLSFGSDLTDKDAIKFFLLWICFHLLVSFAPYTSTIPK